MSNEELVELVKAGDRDAAEELWTQNKGLVESLVQPYRAYLEPDDLIQQAYLGLHYAALNYDPKREAMFSTYLPFWILQSVVKYISQCGHVIRLPEYIRRKIYQRNRRIGELGQVIGRKPTETEIDLYIGETTKAEEAGAAAWYVDSIDRPVSEDDERTLGEMLPDESDPFDEVLDKVQNEELAALLWPLVDELPEKQADVIRKRYREGMAFRDIGEEAGISENGARQREQAALNTLRHRRKTKDLMEFYKDSLAYSMGLRAGGVSSFLRTWTSSTEAAAIKLMKSGTYSRDAPQDAREGEPIPKTENDS